jgi:hypothetical protein
MKRLRLVVPSIDRRKYRRQSTLLSGTLYIGPDEMPCIVDSVSAGGAGVVTRKPLAEHSVVSLYITGHGMFPGRVVWREDKRIGIKFYDTAANCSRFLGISDIRQPKSGRAG